MKLYKKRRKRRKGEINCNCKAYPFPHRMTGGECVGRLYVLRYWRNNQSDECVGCRYHYQEDGEGFFCEVIDGREDNYECPPLAEYLDRSEIPVPKRLNRKRWG